ncbi:MAG: DNRLRE domain-containing protein [candidate division Zixibacteria bacterium]
MRFIILIFMLSSVCMGQTPVGYNKWELSEGKYQSQFGGIFHNYMKPDSSWAEIENDWISDGDTLFTNYRAILQSEVTDKGQSVVTLKYKGNTYTVTQIPKKLIWLKTDTWDWVDIFPSTTWPTPTVNGNILSWNNIFPGVNYRITKRNGAVPHAVMFKPAFLDSAVTLYNQRADSSTIALGNVNEYSLTGVDNADIGIGNVPKRVLKKLKDFVFEISQQRLWHDTVHTDIQVLQRWVKLAGKIYCIEYMMMSDVRQFHEDNPTEVIWHNTETTLDKDDIDDCFLEMNDADDNNGTGNVINLTESELLQLNGLMYIDISVIGSDQQVDSCYLDLFRVTPNHNDSQVYVAPMTATWIETQATWNDRITGTAWSTGGGDYSLCGGEWCDSLTDMGDFGYFQEIGIKSLADGGLAEVVEDWIDGTSTNYGLMMQTEYKGGAMMISSTEESGTGRAPELIVWHSDAEEPPSTTSRRRKVLTGGR